MLVNNYNLKCHKKKKSINPFPGDQQIALSKDYNPRLGSFSIDSCLISLSKKQPYITLQIVTECNKKYTFINLQKGNRKG